MMQKAALIASLPLIECPLKTNGGHTAKTPLYKVVREFNLATYAKVYLIPTLNLVEVYPKLRLGNKDKLGILPNTNLTPEVGKATKRTPPLSEVNAPDTCNLEVVRLAMTKGIFSAGY